MGEIPQCIYKLCGSLLTNQMALSFNINILSGYSFVPRPNQDLEFLTDKESILLHKNVSIFKVYSAMYIKGTHLPPDCKHKRMLENGAPPDKFGVLYRLSHRYFHGSNNNRIDVSGISHFGS